MTFVYLTLAIIACLGFGAAGAWAMRRHTARMRVIAEREDPRDTQIRDMQASMKIAKEDVVKARTRELETNEHCTMAHARIDELLQRLSSVNEKLVASEETLKQEVTEKELMESKLTATSQQAENLQQRVQELEMELKLSHADDMLEPQNSVGTVDETEDQSPEGNLAADVVDSSPSLIQCLTTEMERWKRHCTVLKSQRDKLVSAREAAPDQAPVPYPQNDDLTDIKGIGKVLARTLHELGIYTFERLAAMTDDDFERATELVPDFTRRMNRDDWIGQARLMLQSEASQAAQPTVSRTEADRDLSDRPI